VLWKVFQPGTNTGCVLVWLAIKISGLDIKAGDVIRFDGIHTYRNKIRIDDYNQDM
jgi:hypothetical protein